MGRRQRQGNDKRSQKKKPPLGAEMALWEKEFCKKVGLMEWDVFLRKKENTKNEYKVIEWKDTAGKEAFNNAKKRFWSEKYNIPYADIPLPDPDLYIDHHIDWDSTIDIVEDLDSISVVYEDEKDAQVLLGDPFEPETYQCIIQPTGWEEDDRPAFTASYGDLLGPDN